jgi:hypothetical protein
MAILIVLIDLVFLNGILVNRSETKRLVIKFFFTRNCKIMICPRIQQYLIFLYIAYFSFQAK